MTKIKSITWMTALSLLSTVNAAALECNGLQNAASSELVSYLRKNIPNQGNAECVAFAINEIARCPRFAASFWALTWAMLYLNPARM